MPTKKTAEERRFMDAAIALAMRGRGRTSPNPPVGAVLVKRGRIIGEGWHRKAGGDHAEVAAIKSVKGSTDGSELYVTLEPCCTKGKTGPCTDAILKAGISSVIVGSVDPNPSHKGRGLSQLRRAGVSVKSGLMADQTDELIAPFRKWITKGLPFITLKMAMSIDGRTADSRGRSRWISSEESRMQVKRIRGLVDAVMIGGGTARSDNSTLNPADAGVYQPWRVVISRNGNLDAQCNLLSDRHAARTVIVAGRKSCTKRKENILCSGGARVLRVMESAGKVSLRSAARALGRMGILHVFCEGGATLAASLIDKGLVDRLQIYSAPILLGDDGCTPVIAGRSWTLRRAPRMRLLNSSMIGGDLFAEYSLDNR